MILAMKPNPRMIVIAFLTLILIMLPQSATAQDIYSVINFKTDFNKLTEQQFNIIAQNQLDIMFYMIASYREVFGSLPKDFNELHKSPLFVCDMQNFYTGKPLRPELYVENANTPKVTNSFIDPYSVTGPIGSFSIVRPDITRMQLIMFGPNNYRLAITFQKEVPTFVANYKARNETKFATQDIPFIRSAVLLEEVIPRFGIQTAYWFKNIQLENRYWTKLSTLEMIKISNILKCYPLNAYTGQLIGFSDTYKIGDIYTGPGIFKDNQIYYCVSYGRVRSLKELDDPVYYRTVAKSLLKRDAITLEQAKANKSPQFFTNLKGIIIPKTIKKEKKPVIPYK